MKFYFMILNYFISIYFYFYIRKGNLKHHMKFIFMYAKHIVHLVERKYYVFGQAVMP